MQEVLNVRAPGWQRVVADLTAPVGDDRVYLLRLLSTLGQVCGATQGVLHLVQSGAGEAAGAEVLPVQIWPMPTELLNEKGGLRGGLGVGLDEAMDPTRLDRKLIERLSDVVASARASASSRQVRVFGVEEGQFYDAGSAGKPTVVAVPVPSGLPHEASTLPPRAVITLLLDGRSRQALQSQIAIIELVTGYVFGHEAHQALRRTRQAGASLDLAARLLASINASEGFRGCAMQLANDLCRLLSADRVSVGWMEGSPAAWQGRTLPGHTLKLARRPVRLRALSDTEHIDRRMELCRQIESAMDECLDQEQPVMFPQPTSGTGTGTGTGTGMGGGGSGGDVVLSQAIVHAHRDLARNDATKTVASFPLRIVGAGGERFAGVVTVEAAIDPSLSTAQALAGMPNARKGLDPALIEMVQATLDLIAPVLAVRARDDRTLAQRAWDSCLKGAAWVVGPRHTVWKVAGIALMLATAALALVPVTYRVGATMQVVPVERRTIAAPLEGLVMSLGEGIESGSRVVAGQTLMVLDARELALQLAESQARLAQFEKQMDDALRQGDVAAATEARYKGDEARARSTFLSRQIERSTLTSPINGTIISPDVRDRVGSTVRTGDPLFEVADTSSVRVLARVSDRDIAFVRVGQTGEVSPKSDPSLAVPVRVVSITPLATSVEGENAFDVTCEIDQLAAHDATSKTKAPEASNLFLANQEGRVKLNTQRKPLGWVLSRRAIDQLRIWLWW